MAMGHERITKPLHYFNLPCGLKWGHQKFLRCAKVDSDDGSSDYIGRQRELHVPRSNGVKTPPPRRDPEVGFIRKFRSADGGDGIAAVREKLMFDLQEQADKMKNAIFRDRLEEEKEVSPTPAGIVTAATADADGGSRPWNLRTRRAACKAPPSTNGLAIDAAGNNGGSQGTLKVVDVIGSSLPLRTENKSPRLRSEFASAGAGDSSKREREKFSVSLRRKEIEEDFMTMVGHRPPRRPKKRAKLVQKNLDTLFPGLWLTEITPDLYKVPDDQ